MVPSVLKLLEVNRKTCIDTRGLIAPFGQRLWEDRENPPSIEQTDAFYRRHATQLAVGACRRAIKEWGGQVSDITHTVAVTCTNAGSPGFDQEVVAQLDLRLDVDNILLHGVGCAGGLAALRTAAQMARASGGRPANVLVFACEIPSIQVSVELEDVERNPHPSIGPVLFSDGAAALILCDDAALSSSRGAVIYDLLDWTTMRVPDTESLMAYRMTQLGGCLFTGNSAYVRPSTNRLILTRPYTPLGFRLSLSPEVPLKAISAIGPAFNRMLNAFSQHNEKRWKPQDFDWALHPGGMSIMKGTEAAMNLSEDHLRASYDVYKHHGNASSVAVLAVLDRLRDMGDGRDGIVACSFGPGLMIEMAALRRSRS